jgi:hypothetical protein
MGKIEFNNVLTGISFPVDRNTIQIVGIKCSMLTDPKFVIIGAIENGNLQAKGFTIEAKPIRFRSQITFYQHVWQFIFQSTMKLCE